MKKDFEKINSYVDELQNKGLEKEAEILQNLLVKVAFKRNELDNFDESMEPEIYNEDISDSNENKKTKIPGLGSSEQQLAQMLINLKLLRDRSIANKAAEEAAKAAGEKATKSVAEEAAKTTVKEVAKEGVEQAAKKGLKPLVGKGLKNLFTGKQFGKFTLFDTLANMGVDYAKDFFEDAQGPYKYFKNHKSDIIDIISEINSLVGNENVKTATNNLMDLLSDIEKELEELKVNLKVAQNSSIKKVYNHKQTKLAIRGEARTRVPGYLQDLLQGAIIGGTGGAIFGGGLPGAIPGALLGALGRVGGRAIEDIYYDKISDTGKAYFQGKDLEQKITRLSNLFQKFDPDLSRTIDNKADEVLMLLEKINKDNPNKTYLENVFQSIEEKLGV